MLWNVNTAVEHIKSYTVNGLWWDTVNGNNFYLSCSLILLPLDQVPNWNRGGMRNIEQGRSQYLWGWKYYGRAVTQIWFSLLAWHRGHEVTMLFFPICPSIIFLFTAYKYGIPNYLELPKHTIPWHVLSKMSICLSTHLESSIYPLKPSCSEKHSQSKFSL